MRPVNYLQDLADQFREEHSTLVVIDRSLAEFGLRSKGKGRAIPRPTLKEHLLICLAIRSGFPAIKGGEGAAFWANLRCRTVTGEQTWSRFKGKQLIEVLEALILAQAKLFGENPDQPILPLIAKLEIDHTDKVAFIDLGTFGSQTHVIFGAENTSGAPKSCAIFPSHFFEVIAGKQLRGEFNETVQVS